MLSTSEFSVMNGSSKRELTEFKEIIFCFSHLPNGNQKQRTKLKHFLEMLDIFEFGTYRNISDLNFREDARIFSRISVRKLYKQVSRVLTKRRKKTNFIYFMCWCYSYMLIQILCASKVTNFRHFLFEY